MKRVSKKILLPALFLAVGGGGAALLVATKPKPPALKVEEQAWVVAVQKVQRQAVAPSLTLFGRVESPRAAQLVAAIDADVRAVPAREGLAVKAGQLLVQLDDREARLTVDRRAAEVRDVEAQIAAERQQHESDVAALAHEQELLQLAEQALARANEIKAKQLISQAAVDEARQAVARQSVSAVTRRLAVDSHPARLAQLEARLAKARADLASARLDLEHTRIVAPFAGRLAKVQVAPGGRVTMGTALLEIYDTAALEIRAQIPAPQVAALRRMLTKSGQVRGSAEVDGETVAVTLDRLAGQVDADSGGVDGLFHVTRGADVLALGRFVDLVIDLPPAADVVVLPYASLYGLNRLYVIRDGRMAGVEVEVVGERRADGGRQVLVRSPALHEGAEVVVTHLPNAIEGLRVKAAQGS